MDTYKRGVTKMDNDILALLEEEISLRFSKISWTTSNEEYGQVLEHIKDLHNMRMAEVKAINESKDKVDKDKQELMQYIRVGVDVMLGLAPVVAYACFVRQGFRFEETGTISSGIFKGIIQKIKLTK